SRVRSVSSSSTISRSGESFMAAILTDRGTPAYGRPARRIRREPQPGLAVYRVVRRSARGSTGARVSPRAARGVLVDDDARVRTRWRGDRARRVRGRPRVAGRGVDRHGRTCGWLARTPSDREAGRSRALDGDRRHLSATSDLTSHHLVRLTERAHGASTFVDLWSVRY